jgi:uncharacterized protein (TIGR03067 family)
MQLGAVLAVGLLLGAGGQKDAGQDELKKFQGTWRFQSWERDGKAMPADELKNQTVTFQGDRFTLKQGDKVIQAGTHRLDPTKTPRTVDATVTEGEDKGNTMLGIYEMQGDTMRACFDPSGKKRPTEFKAPSGSGLFTVTIKRDKASK